MKRRGLFMILGIAFVLTTIGFITINNDILSILALYLNEAILFTMFGMWILPKLENKELKEWPKQQN